MSRFTSFRRTCHPEIHLVPPILMPLFLLLGNRNRICAQVAQWLFPSPTTHKTFPQIIPLFEFPSYPSRIHQRLVRPGNEAVCLPEARRIQKLRPAIPRVPQCWLPHHAPSLRITPSLGNHPAITRKLRSTAPCRQSSRASAACFSPLPPERARR